MRFIFFAFLFYFIFSREDVFIGYKKWQNSQPFVAVKNFNTLEYVGDVILVCKGSSHVKISEEKSFKDAEWLDYRAKYDWIFRRKEGKKLITLFVVFRRKNPITSLYEISPVVNTVIDLENPQNKLEFTDSGLINWTKGEITIYSKVTTKTNLLIRQLETLQRKAEEQINEIAFLQVSQIYYNYPYRIESFLKKDSNNLFSYLKKIRLDNILYGSNYVQLNYRLSFYGNSHTNLFSLYQKNYQEITPTRELKFLENKEKKYSKDSFSNIIVDVRDFYNFRISLIPKIIDLQKNTLFSPLFYTPRKMSSNENLNNGDIDTITNSFDNNFNNTTNENLQTNSTQQDQDLYKRLFKTAEKRAQFSSFQYLRKVEFLQNAVYVKPLEVDSYSRIIISDRYKKYFINSKNKNLILLVN